MLEGQNVLFRAKTGAEIEELPITNGQLIFDTDENSGKMYLDDNNQRKPMGGGITVDTELSKTSTNPIQNQAVANNVIDDLDTIKATTEQGFMAGALAVKEVNDSLGGVQFQVVDGKLQFRYETEV